MPAEAAARSARVSLYDTGCVLLAIADDRIAACGVCRRTICRRDETVHTQRDVQMPAMADSALAVSHGLTCRRWPARNNAASL